MKIYLWKQSNIADSREKLYNQNGELIPEENNDRQKIIDKIFTLNSGKQIIYNNLLRVNKNMDSLIIDFHSEDLDESGRKLPCIIFYENVNTDINLMLNQVKMILKNTKTTTYPTFDDVLLKEFKRYYAKRTIMKISIAIIILGSILFFLRRYLNG